MVAHPGRPQEAGDGRATRAMGESPEENPEKRTTGEWTEAALTEEPADKEAGYTPDCCFAGVLTWEAVDDKAWSSWEWRERACL